MSSHPGTPTTEESTTEAGAGSGEFSKRFPHTAELLRQRQNEAEAAQQADDDRSPEKDGNPPSQQQQQPVAATATTRTRKRKSRGEQKQLMLNKIKRRQEEAQKRRELFQHERSLAFEAAERDRQRKIQITRDLRRQAIHTFIREAPIILRNISAAGLRSTNPMPPPEAIEHILISDPWVCAHCGGVEGTIVTSRACPQTKKPHRRYLVCEAEKLLRLIGDTRVNLQPPRDPFLGESAAAVAGSRTRRGITVNPHLFIVAYYTAACVNESQKAQETLGEPPEGMLDVLLCECAKDVIEVTGQIADALKANEKEPSSVSSPRPSEIKPLLQTFAKVWRQYARVADRNVPMTPEDREQAKLELLNGAIAAYLETMDSPAIGEARLLQEALQARVVKLGGAEGEKRLEEAKRARMIELMETKQEEEDEEEEEDEGKGKEKNEKKKDRPLNTQEEDNNNKDGGGEEGSDTMDSTTDLATTPEFRPQRQPSYQHGGETIQPMAPLPPAMMMSAAGGGGGGGTSASDTDGGMFIQEDGTAVRKAAPMGPSLPPLWYVDEQGISRPPSEAVLEEQRKRETFQRLAHRAQAAHRSKVSMKQKDEMQLTQDRAVLEFRRLMEGEIWSALADDLSQSPPKLNRIPALLDLVTQRLGNAIPRRIRSQVQQELRDVLDWSSIRFRLRNALAVFGLYEYVMRKVIELGAPARESELHEKIAEIKKRFDECEDPHTLIVDTFRYMFEAIHQLELDISKFSLQMIQGDLATHAVEFQREFIEKCLPSPSEWRFSLRWMQHVLTELSSPPDPELEVSHGSFKLRGMVTRGVLHLLVSTGHTGETRWKLFPHEVLYFDKPIIFASANTVQLCCLRLMLQGTLKLILSKYSLSAPNVAKCSSIVDKMLVQAIQACALEPPPNSTANLTRSTSSTLPSVSSLTSLNASAAAASASGVQETALSLPVLKQKIIEEVNYFLFSASQENSSTTTATTTTTMLLKEPDQNMLIGVIDKMVDTSSAQYSTFEKKVIRNIQLMVFKKLRILATVPSEPLPTSAMGIVASDLEDCVTDLVSMLCHNWEVYVNYYESLMQLCSSTSALAAASQQQETSH